MDGRWEKGKKGRKKHLLDDEYNKINTPGKKNM